MIGGDGIGTEDFGLIAGPAGEGTLLSSTPDFAGHAAAAPVVARFREQGVEPTYDAILGYAAVQVWAEAVATAGTFETDAVANTLRSREFDTVLGTIGFDDKGDVYGYEPFAWYVWQDGDWKRSTATGAGALPDCIKHFRRVGGRGGRVSARNDDRQSAAPRPSRCSTWR